MDDNEWMVERFEEHRAHLRAVAYRMLGSLAEAEDAVQEAWLRLSRADTSEVVLRSDRGGRGQMTAPPLGAMTCPVM